MAHIMSGSLVILPIAGTAKQGGQLDKGRLGRVACGYYPGRIVAGGFMMLTGQATFCHPLTPLQITPEQQILLGCPSPEPVNKPGQGCAKQGTTQEDAKSRQQPLAP